MDGESSGQSQPLSGHRSESKVLVGQKRGSMEIEETYEKSQKRVKMRDLESVFRSEGKEGSNTAHQEVLSDSRTLDLNVDVGDDDDPACVDESNNPPITGKKDVQCNDGPSKTKGFDLDLNAADISSSINDLFYPYKMNEHLSSRDDSDCVSSVGPLEGKDPMRVWKGLKQNNYMSSTPYGAVPMAIPKARGRKKSTHDVMKKKMELAKKEQVDRFARVAAPSGLLNGLNPGIINHVRNSKQVHSIIEALVKSERTENLLSESKKFNQIKEHTDRKENEDVSDYSLFPKSVYPNTEVSRRDGDSCMGYTMTFSRLPSQCGKVNEDDKLPLKLASSMTVASENASCLSNDESANLSSVNSLSLKAANVASQWLDLLNQDVRGRLAVLRRSRKRVRAVITTELPHLMSREFSSNPNKDVEMTNIRHFDQAKADAHAVKWSTLFAQMDEALSEEESRLENWLKQVKEMQLHCDMGLSNNSLYHASHQMMAPLGNHSRLVVAEGSEKDLAVQAAAASIYSTCNFLLSRENLPCC